MYVWSSFLKKCLKLFLIWLPKAEIMRSLYFSFYEISNCQTNLVIIWAFVIVFIHKFTWCICHLNFLQPTYDNTLKRHLFHQFLEKKVRKSLVEKTEQLKPRVMLAACPMCPPNLALSAQLPAWKPPGNNAEWLSAIDISACSLCSSISLLLVFVVYNSTSGCF